MNMIMIREITTTAIERLADRMGCAPAARRWTVGLRLLGVAVKHAYLSKRFAQQPGLAGMHALG
jgi:hypothetical protein